MPLIHPYPILSLSRLHIAGNSIILVLDEQSANSSPVRGRERERERESLSNKPRVGVQREEFDIALSGFPLERASDADSSIAGPLNIKFLKDATLV